MRTADPAQAEIDFTSPTKEPPAASVGEVARLVELLSGKGWQTAAELAVRSGGWSDRKVRLIASAAVPGVVSYPGSPGYKLWAECSVEEINHAIEAFESQARDMAGRAIFYRQAYHGRFRGLSGS